MDEINYSDEVWAEAYGWEGIYEVSSCGRVKRVGKSKAALVGRILKTQKGRAAYPMINLTRNNIRKSVSIHILVAESFLGPRPTWNHQVNHIDANKRNPRLSNLEWLTRQENMAHAHRLGLMSQGETHAAAKLTDESVNSIRKRYSCGELGKHLAVEYGVSRSVISLIVNRKSWNHI